jgi:hypothetical protein
MNQISWRKRHRHAQLWLVLLLLQGWQTCTWAQIEDFQLILESSRRVVRLGGDAKCELKIAGKGVQVILNAASGIYVPLEDAVFQSKFKFKPTRAGVTELGPFALSFMNKSLRSNNLKVKVLEEWTRGPGVALTFADDEIRLGETTQLVVEEFYFERDSSISWWKHLKANEQMEVRSGLSFSSTSIGSGRKLESRGEVFDVTPKVRGKLVISREKLNELPNSVTFNPVALTVR